MEKECVKKGAVKNCLSIAGVDPSGGAGVLADIKAMSACGVYAMGVVTALTAQNTRGVTGVMPVPADFVGKELEAVFTDVPPAAVKIGMLNDAAVIGVVAGALRRYKPRWVVLDPVMVAKSGDRLLREDALEALKTELLPLADIVTPNLPEAGDLLGRTVETKEALQATSFIRAGKRFGLKRRVRPQKIRTARAVRSLQPLRRFLRARTMRPKPYAWQKPISRRRLLPPTASVSAAATAPYIILYVSGRQKHRLCRVSPELFLIGRALARPLQCPPVRKKPA